MSLLKQPKLQTYKPFHYPWAYETFKKHEALHWLPEEVPLGEDVKDWNEIDAKQKAFLHSIFSLFTQNDVQVGAGYDVLLRIFKPTEVQMMLRGNAARENIHIDGYSLLLDTLGLPDDTYSEFLEIPEMRCKMEYLNDCKVKKFEEYLAAAREELKPYGTDDEVNELMDKMYRKDIAKMLAVYASFTEGVSLFASFIMLLNYQRFNKFPGMCQIVTWSIRDEEMHVQGNTQLFKAFIRENLDIWNDTTKQEIYSACREVVAMEEAFIDYVFANGLTEGLTKDEMKTYVHYIADRRLIELGLKGNWGVKDNPLPWVEEILNTPEFGNFFETRVTEYSKGTLTGSWDELRNS